MTGEPRGPGGGEPLLRLADIGDALGATRLQKEALALRERLDEGRFHVACVGQFKRGKSSLLNALIGRPVLPTGIVPVTGACTLLRYAGTCSGVVHFLDGRVQPVDVDAIHRFISATENPGNALGVDAVELSVPAPILRDGLCLVDTPGLGSVFRENGATASAYVPSIDAALLVVGTDPPLSGEELALAREIGRHVHDLIVVLNKADRFTDDERAEAKRFAAESLARALGRPVDPILEVSAIERLGGTGPVRDWEALHATLDALRARARGALVPSAYERGVARLAAHGLRVITETTDALFRSLDDSLRRIEALRKFVGDVAHDALREGFRMESEAARLLAAALEREERFLAAALPRAREEMRHALRAARARESRPRRELPETARAIARRHLDAWVDVEWVRVAHDRREAVGEAVQRIRHLLERSRALAEVGVDDVSLLLPPADHFMHPMHRVAGEPEARAPAPPSLGRRLREAIARRARRRAIEGHVMADLEQLMRRESACPREELDRALGRSFREIKAELHRLLQEMFEAAEDAASHARAVTAAGDEARRREIARLQELRREVLAIAASARPAD